MKKNFIILLTSLILFGCNDQKLDTKKAFSIIQKEFDFPKTIDYDIFCSDPAHARKILLTDLEEKEWIKIRKNLKLKNIGEPLITFTNKAKPYLLPTSEEYEKLDIQKVKIAEVDLDEIIKIHHHSDLDLTEVEYTTRLQKLTPFSVLYKMSLNEKKSQKVYFKFSDKNWQIVKGKDVPCIFMNSQ